jgi:hypothetical protein
VSLEERVVMFRCKYIEGNGNGCMRIINTVISACIAADYSNATPLSYFDKTLL